jgi:hypothetical protein
MKWGDGASLVDVTLYRSAANTLATDDAYNIKSTTDSSSTSTGALIVAAGVGIAKNLYDGGNDVLADRYKTNGYVEENISGTNYRGYIVGDDGTFAGLTLAHDHHITLAVGDLDAAGTLNSKRIIFLANDYVELTQPTLIGGTYIGGAAWGDHLVIGNDSNEKCIAGYLASSSNMATFAGHSVTLGAWAPVQLCGSDVYLSDSETKILGASSSQVSIYPTTDSSSTSTGALVVAGGVGIAKKLYVGGSAAFLGFSCVSSTLISSTGIYNNTTGSASNVFIDGLSGGFQIQRSTSSLKYKTNVKYEENLEIIVDKLSPATWNDKTSGQKYMGLIAEDVSKVDRRLVVYDENNEPDALHYGHFVAPLVAKCQSLQKQNDTQQEIITQLEDRLAKLEKILINNSNEKGV